MAATDLVVSLTGASGMPYGVRLLEVLLRAGRTIHLTLSPAACQVLEQEMDRVIVLPPSPPERGQSEGPPSPPGRGQGEGFRLAALLPTATEADSRRVHYHDYRDFHAGIASGSFLTSGMVICPCSMGTVGAIAHGLGQNLIHRAADVHLKEKRKLILVPRETPLHAMHLRNLALCAEAGAVILPAMPGFYTRPHTLSDLVDFIVARICDHLGVDHDLGQRWGE